MRIDGKQIDGKQIDPRASPQVAKRIQPIYQDSYSLLNPCRTAAQIVGLPLMLHECRSQVERNADVKRMLDLVEVPCVVAQPRRFIAERCVRAGARPANLMGVPHSYPACSQHAPDEHLPGSVARHALQIMAGLFWDLAGQGTGIRTRRLSAALFYFNDHLTLIDRPNSHITNDCFARCVGFFDFYIAYF